MGCVLKLLIETYLKVKMYLLCCDVQSLSGYYNWSGIGLTPSGGGENRTNAFIWFLPNDGHSKPYWLRKLRQKTAAIRTNLD